MVRAYCVFVQYSSVCSRQLHADPWRSEAWTPLAWKGPRAPTVPTLGTWVCILVSSCSRELTFRLQTEYWLRALNTLATTRNEGAKNNNKRPQRKKKKIPKKPVQNSGDYAGTNAPLCRGQTTNQCKLNAAIEWQIWLWLRFAASQRSDRTRKRRWPSKKRRWGWQVRTPVLIVVVYICRSPGQGRFLACTSMC